MAKEIKGIVPVLCTPFNEDGSLDEESLRRLIDYCIDEVGVHGISGPGSVGECDQLSEGELQRVIDIMVEEARGRVPVVIGLTCPSISTTVLQSKYAQAAGADAIFTRLATTRGVTRQAIYTFYRALGEAIEIPILLYDLNPPLSVPTEMIVRLNEEFPHICYVKEETSPAGRKITEVLAACQGKVKVLSAQGACHLIDNLVRGVVGNMPGCHVLRSAIKIWEAWQRGDIQAARKEHNRVAPLMLFRQLPGWGTVVVKEILFRNGIFKTTLMREPTGPLLDERDKQELTEILETIGWVF